MIGLIASGLFLVFPSIPGADLSLFQPEQGTRCPLPGASHEPSGLPPPCPPGERLSQPSSGTHHRQPVLTSRGGLVPVGVASSVNNRCFPFRSAVLSRGATTLVLVLPSSST